MPVCGYVVMPRKGTAAETARALSRIPGCEVHPAENADVLLMVTTADTFEGDAELRKRIQEVENVDALLLTFGEIDPDTPIGDPVGARRR